MVSSLVEGASMNSPDPKATVHLSPDDLFTGITPSQHAVTIDADSQRALAPSPMELLLIALGSCAAVDVIGILRKKRGDVKEYRVEVRGERRDDHPRSYKRLELRHIVRGRNITERALKQAIELSESKYCSVAATLKPTAEIVSSFELIEAEAK